MNEKAKIVERLTRHQIFVQQFSGGEINKVMPVLRQLAEDMQNRIASGSATEFQMNRIGAIQEDLRALARQAAGDIQGQLDLEDFAIQEADFTERLLGAAVNVDLAEGISADRLSAVMTRKPMQLVSGDTVKRVTIADAFDEFSEAMGRDVMRKVQAGILEGRTQQDMARDVASVVDTRSRQQAETLIRSATNHVGSVAREEVYAANDDIMDGVRWVSTLDSRVSASCRARDGMVFPKGEGPRPPGHYGCRSLVVPEIKPEYQVTAKGERASMDGPVSNQMTYGGFLKRQSAELQDKVLGPTRAKLFRSGELRIDQFVDDRGIQLSLSELRQRFDITME